LIRRIHFFSGLIILFLVLSVNVNAQQSGKGMLSIAFNHYVNEALLKLDSTVYKNELGQTYTISNFKYYISNFNLTLKNGKTIDLPGYFLINEEEESSKKILLNSIPAGEYSSISFIVGVDSLHNCSGAQSDALDPVNAMFWAWNTGYIFLKLEGKSSFSTSPGKIIEYHVGGYKVPSNCIRTIAMKFDMPLKISSDKTSSIDMNVNVSEILSSPYAIDFTKLSVVTDARNATTIADNYKDMFSISKINNEK
jgi:hypothetical protein